MRHWATQRWDQTWPGLNQAHRNLRPRKWLALGLVLAVTAIGWSSGTVRAVAILTGAYGRTVYGDDWARALADTAENLSLGLAVCLISYLAIRYYLGLNPAQIGLALPRSRTSLKTAATTGAYFTVMLDSPWVSFLLGGLRNVRSQG